MEQLRDDTRYETAVTGIESELTLTDAIQWQWGNSAFPECLKLSNLPDTIMSYYSDADKKGLFPTEDSTSAIIHTLATTEFLTEAVIHSFNDRKKFA
jgi:hypothetical protein